VDVRLTANSRDSFYALFTVSQWWANQISHATLKSFKNAFSAKREISRCSKHAVCKSRSVNTKRQSCTFSNADSETRPLGCTTYTVGLQMVRACLNLTTDLKILNTTSDQILTNPKSNVTEWQPIKSNFSRLECSRLAKAVKHVILFITAEERVIRLSWRIYIYRVAQKRHSFFGTP